MSVKKGLLHLPDARDLGELLRLSPGTEAGITRKVLHEWPLSCVELVTEEGTGRRWVVKSQLAEASVEVVD